MGRRTILRAAVAASAWFMLSGHSPYRHWDVHRKTRLVLLVSASEPPSVVLGKALAALYSQRLPESRASMARARDNNDVLRLLASKQLDVALLREDYAYERAQEVALRALAQLGQYPLLCRDDLPASSAYMLTEALAEGWREIQPALVGTASGPRPRETMRIPLHPGALEYYSDHE